MIGNIGTVMALNEHWRGHPLRPRFIKALGLMLILGSAAVSGAAFACNCGPDFCADDPRIPATLQGKKANLAAQGFAPALTALLDKADRCVAAINRAPDTFSLMTVRNGGNILVVELSSDNESIARTQLINDTLSAYYKFNVREAFACCQRPAAAERPDWSTTLSLSIGQSIACKKSGSSVVCN